MPIEVEKKEPLRCELEHFVTVLLGKSAPRVGGEAARAAVATAQAILRCMEQ